jgi:hypothetical protein
MQSWGCGKDADCFRGRMEVRRDGQRRGSRLDREKRYGARPRMVVAELLDVTWEGFIRLRQTDTSQTSPVSARAFGGGRVVLSHTHEDMVGGALLMLVLRASGLLWR